MLAETYKPFKLEVEHCPYCGAKALIPFFRHKNSCPAPYFEDYYRHVIDLRCFVFGHEFDNNNICEHCGIDGVSSYFNCDPVSDIGMKLKGLFNSIKSKFYISFCPVCGKLEYFFNKKVGNHDQCLPF